MRASRFIAMMVLLLVAATACNAQDDPPPAQQAILQQAQDDFAEGVRLRHDHPEQSKAAFDRAIAGFERIEQDFGIVNGGVQYNIGNSYLMSGRIGRAIAAYRRAQLLRPGDHNVRTNLHVARSRVLDRFEKPTGSVVARALVFWRQWPGERQVIVFLLGNALLWLPLALRLVGVRMPRWPAVLGAVVAGVMALSLALDLSRAEQWAGVVVDGAVTGRQGPGGEGEYEPSFTRSLSEGVEFEVVEDRDQWLLVELGDGRQTWLPRGRVEVFAAR